MIFRTILVALFLTIVTCDENLGTNTNSLYLACPVCGPGRVFTKPDAIGVYDVDIGYYPRTCAEMDKIARTIKTMSPNKCDLWAFYAQIKCGCVALTRKPTRMPTRKPTRNPTRKPTRMPTRKPTKNKKLKKIGDL